MENRPADTAGASEKALARACDIANRDEDVAAMEREFEVISRDVAEPWNNAPPR
jgi:hypothetical protein